MADNKIFTLGWKDVVKGFITAFLTALVTSIYQVIQNGDMPTWPQFKVTLIAATGAALAYLIKNLLTNSNDQFLTKEPPKP